MTTSDGPRGAADRVAKVHHQARWTLGVAAAFIVSAPIAAVVPHDTGAWLPLHLFLAGGLLSGISGATQMLAVTWSSSPAPSDRATAVQRAMLAGGALAVALGREVDAEVVTAIGGLAVAVALVILAVLLVGIRRAAVTPRFTPAIDAYLLAIAYGLVGVGLGIDMASRSSYGHGLRDAHLTINVLGLVGLVIIGTLPFFVATQVRSKMSPRATPGRVRAIVGASAASVAIAATAHAIERPGIAAVGLGLYVVCIGAVAAVLPGVGRRQLGWAGARVVQLFAGIGWWALTVAGLAVLYGTGGGDDRPLLRALAIGGIAQIVVASLSYFGPVLRGGGHEPLTRGFELTRSWLAVAGANVAAAGALADVDEVMAAGLALWLVTVLWRTGIFAVETARMAR
ncbi:MAG: hypothetical protein JJE52_01030 [Acidimicrobiia bacterium]|nr:hypothetical protein [Acidimicrobiia bacterium]